MRLIPQPKFTEGAEWWAGPLWTLISGVAARVPHQPHRPMSLDSLCAGTAAEAVGIKVPRSCFVSYCEVSMVSWVVTVYGLQFLEF